MSDLNVGVASLRSTPTAAEGANKPARPGVDDGKFKEQLAALQNATPTPAAKAAPPVSTLKFSNHAIDRMQARGISFSPEQMTGIQNAIGKASAKGAKDTLLLTDNSALIVSVKDNTVVTVMDRASLRDQVFTKIDSAVVI